MYVGHSKSSSIAERGTSSPTPDSTQAPEDNPGHLDAIFWSNNDLPSSSNEQATIETLLNYLLGTGGSSTPDVGSGFCFELSLFPRGESPVPVVDPTPPLANHSMMFLLRTLRTWPQMIAKGLQMPPMSHHSVPTTGTMPLPLANCFTRTKMWSHQCPGATAMIQETIQKELKFLLANVRRNNQHANHRDADSSFSAISSTKPTCSQPSRQL